MANKEALELQIDQLEYLKFEYSCLISNLQETKAKIQNIIYDMTDVELEKSKEIIAHLQNILEGIRYV